MLPKRIKLYFETLFQKKDGKNDLIKGVLSCCNSHEFEILINGKVERSMFLRMYLHPENNKIALIARCKKCGRHILIFDSSCDGYDQYNNKQSICCLPTKHINCCKCQKNLFSVSIKYEYPAIQELRELEIAEVDNAFTWIWIDLECSNCGAVYRNFIDYETA